MGPKDRSYRESPPILDSEESDRPITPLKQLPPILDPSQKAKRPLPASHDDGISKPPLKIQKTGKDQIFNHQTRLNYVSPYVKTELEEFESQVRDPDQLQVQDSIVTSCGSGRNFIGAATNQHNEPEEPGHSASSGTVEEHVQVALSPQIQSPEPSPICSETHRPAKSQNFHKFQSSVAKSASHVESVLNSITMSEEHIIFTAPMTTSDAPPQPQQSQILISGMKDNASAGKVWFDLKSLRLRQQYVAIGDHFSYRFCAEERVLHTFDGEKPEGLRMSANDDYRIYLDRIIGLGYDDRNTSTVVVRKRCPILTKDRHLGLGESDMIHCELKSDEEADRFFSLLWSEEIETWYPGDK